MGLKTAALIRNGTVENVAVYDEDTSKAWLDSVKPKWDSVLIVDVAAIGWEEYEPGKVRMPQPGPDCVWTGDEWDCPEPEPEG
jgi:Ni,Fe-hydrogenase maturation factor